MPSLQKIFLFTFILLLFNSPLFSAGELPFLRKVQKDSIYYFSKYSNPKTGLTADSSLPRSPSSISATGFHLLSLVIAAENNWLPKKEAYKKTKKILNVLKTKAEHKNGFFYHFLSHKTGKRTWASEASSIDTALLIANVLVAGEYFKNTPVEKMAHQLYDRVDWQWMLNKTKLFSHGYKPESGFLPYYWDSYSEHLILQVLAIGARENAVESEVWKEWFRLEDTYEQRKVVYAHSGSLFTYQLSHIFLDFRKLYDLDVNYFENSVQATLANRAFCLNNSANFKTYQDNFWGLSACLGPKGYKAYGAKPGRGFHDGTVSPYSILSSLVFTPAESLETIKKLYTEHKDKIYGTCGFRDGFNLEKNWFAQRYIGIDQGATIGMIENHETELIWKLFMSLALVQKWIKLCNLKETPPPTIPSREVQISPVKTPETQL